MNDPKRAEPANEHAKALREAALEVMSKEFSGDQCGVSATCVRGAAEIERLAARVREIDAAGEMCLKMEAAHEWLPIADAPRDGTRVELWCEHLDGINSGQFVRFASYGRYECGEDYEQWLSDAGFDLQPTHYRREPSGPDLRAP